MPRDKMSGPKRLVKSTQVPIFDATIFLAVAENVDEIRPLFTRIFGDDAGLPEKAEGFSTTDRSGTFLVYIRSDCVTPQVVCHEIHHVTRQILEWCDVTETGSCETAAHLCGWISGWAMRQLNK